MTGGARPRISDSATYAGPDPAGPSSPPVAVPPRKSAASPCLYSAGEADDRSSNMTTPLRASLMSSTSVAAASSPPPSPRAPLASPEAPLPTDHPGAPPPPPPSAPALHAPSAATTSTARSRPRPSSPHPAAAPAAATTHGRSHAARSLRAQALTRLAGRSSSTPRARLARGGPPRVSVRERPPEPPPPPPPTLVRYHWSTIIILVLYLPLLIVPWIIVCILDVKPLTWHGASYETSGWYTAVSLSLCPSASVFVLPCRKILHDARQREPLPPRVLTSVTERHRVGATVGARLEHPRLHLVRAGVPGRHYRALACLGGVCTECPPRPAAQRKGPVGFGGRVLDEDQWGS